MADSRSVMQEFRFLDQKRQSGTLTPAEQARHAELRDLVGFEQPTPARGGFDVTAAAAQLRESLLPAGLRSRPVDPAPAPSADPAAWSPPLQAAPGPAAFAEPEPPLAIDSFFDPASLGQEVRPQAWNPEAPGYDPNALWDEAAWIAAGYDPNATYDWGDGSVPGDGAAPGDASVDAPPAEAPLQFGEYDAPGAPAPALAAEAGWLEDGGPPPPPPPQVAPAFGDYDAMPGGPPLELGEAPIDLQPESELEVGFVLASDGSFGEAGGPPLLTPWSETDQPSAAERWESAPALDLSAPFEAAVVPLPAPPVEPVEPVEPLASLEPEEAVPPAEPFFESLPAELEPALPAPTEAEPEPLVLAEADLDPVSLGELEQPDEIDIPPEISAAYDLPPATAAALDFAPPPPSEVAAVLGPSTEPVAEAADADPEIEPVSLAPSGTARVGGAQRAVVHLLNGQVLRGTLTDADLEAPELELDTGSPGAPELVTTAAVKAIFFMLAPGERPPVAEGKRVRVTFRDGRQVAGFSSGYREELAGFFMVPADTRTNTARIWVYQAAVKQVSVS